MHTTLAPLGSDPLAPSRLRCAPSAVAPLLAELSPAGLIVDPGVPERLRARLRSLAPADRPRRVLLAPAGGIDPFGPDPHLQSAAFLTASAALESGVGVSLVTRGVPARGFLPLFRRYPRLVTAHISVALAEHESARFASDAGPGDEQGPGEAPPAARFGAIAALAGAGVATWLRIDPAVPGVTDDPSVLGPWLADAAAAGAAGVVVCPLVLDDAGTALVEAAPAVVDYYRPGRRPRRGALPAPPQPHLPVERETALVWRVRREAEDARLTVRLCRCRRGVPGACGLVPPRTPDTRRGDLRQMSLWAG